MSEFFQADGATMVTPSFSLKTAKLKIFSLKKELEISQIMAGGILHGEIIPRASHAGANAWLWVAYVEKGTSFWKTRGPRKPWIAHLNF